MRNKSLIGIKRETFFQSSVARLNRLEGRNLFIDREKPVFDLNNIKSTNIQVFFVIICMCVSLGQSQQLTNKLIVHPGGSCIVWFCFVARLPVGHEKRNERKMNPNGPDTPKWGKKTKKQINLKKPVSRCRGGRLFPPTIWTFGVGFLDGWMDGCEQICFGQVLSLNWQAGSQSDAQVYITAVRRHN